MLPFTHCPADRSVILGLEALASDKAPAIHLSSEGEYYLGDHQVVLEDIALSLTPEQAISASWQANLAFPHYRSIGCLQQCNLACHAR